MNQETCCFKPRTLFVTWTEKKEVQATRAVIYAVLESKKIIFSDAAMKEAGELNEVAAKIKSIEGMAEKDISLIGLSASTEGGVVSRSSASYRISVSVKDLRFLPAVLNVLLADKNVKVKDIIWHYPITREKETLLEPVISSAREKAEKIARLLGVKISGVHSFKEEPSSRYFGSPRLERSVGAAGQNYFNFEVSATTEISLTVEVEYLID